MRSEGKPPLDEESQPSKKLSDGKDDDTIEQAIKDDGLYCLQSTFVFFQAERSLFCVPIYRFVDQSNTFTKLFNLPEPNASNIKGSTRNDPIVLPDVSQGDFHNFLKALYPLVVSAHLKLTKAEWISALRLSTLWYFLEYRKMAIRSLKEGKELSSTDKIVYGREFKIRSWIEEGCSELVSRDKPIDREEAVVVGFETTFSLFRIRGKRIQGTLGKFGMMIAIREALKDELDLVGRSELEYRTDEDEAPWPITQNTPEVPATKEVELVVPKVAEAEAEATLPFTTGKLFGTWAVSQGPLENTLSNNNPFGGASVQTAASSSRRKLKKK